MPRETPEEAPGEMPRFAMPRTAAAEPPPLPEGSPGRSAPALVQEPLQVADGASRPARFSWRQLLVAGLVCALVGAAVPFAVQAAGRAAATASIDELRGSAAAYLDALVEGDWSAATALVPLGTESAELAPPAVLDSAVRIEDPEVALAHVDGDAGVVQVRYRVGTAEVSRLLDAVRADGECQLTSSLAELPRVINYDGISIPAVAGVELGRPAPQLLYPGAYTLDLIENPIYQFGGDGFTIDGDPATLTEIGASVAIAQSLLDQAQHRATLHAGQCFGTGACAWPDSAAIDADGAPYAPRWVGSSEVVVQVPLVASSGEFNEHVGITVRLTVGEDGDVLAATCQGLTGFSDEPIACEA